MGKWGVTLQTELGKKLSFKENLSLCSVSLGCSDLGGGAAHLFIISSCRHKQ